ncbi:MAG: peptide-methionine (S)-S-oxide reductase MsrA [Planctomycetota bacterium]|nr:peptide-methionine (S)-S-oxide reductase MsrA [Planctomycetota bacterium]
METATFGAGCFWCVEAIYQRVDGVASVTSGYMGGSVENPTYKQVCTGETGHAEVCQIVFDPAKVGFGKLLEVFFHSAHDPTTLNRQGADEGTQYRSVIFYHSEAQKKAAEEAKRKLNDENAFGKPVVTEISPAKTYYKAEDYHQDYFDLHGEQPYCRSVIAPKVEKFEKKLKEEKAAGK